MLPETIVLGALWLVAFSLVAFIGKAQVDKMERVASASSDHDKRLAVVENRRTESRIDKLDAQHLLQAEDISEVKQTLHSLKTDLLYIRSAIDDLRKTIEKD